MPLSGQPGTGRDDNNFPSSEELKENTQVVPVVDEQLRDEQLQKEVTA